MKAYNTTWTVKNCCNEFFFVMNFEGSPALVWTEYEEREAANRIVELLNGADVEEMEENSVFDNKLEDGDFEDIAAGWENYPVIADENGLHFAAAKESKSAKYALTLAQFMLDADVAVEKCEVASEVVDLISIMSKEVDLSNYNPRELFKTCVSHILQVSELSTKDLESAVYSLGRDLEIFDDLQVDLYDEEGNPATEADAVTMEVNVDFSQYCKGNKDMQDDIIGLFRDSSWEVDRYDSEHYSVSVSLKRAMSKEELKKELAYAIRVWKNGGDCVVKMDGETVVDYDGFLWYLNGAEMYVEDIPDDEVDEYASNYVDLFEMDIFNKR